MTAVLDHLLHVPEGAVEGAPVAVLLHGRGSHRGDLQGLASLLPPATVLVTPEAPHPGSPWGYGPGWAWYRYAGEDRVEWDTLSESLVALDGFLDALPSLLPFRPGPLFLGGFSQGGTTSLAWALTRRARSPRVTGVLNFSGFLAAVPEVEEHLGSAKGLEVFWGHGVRDPNIPHPLAVRGRARLAEAGARLESRDYAIGHWIEPEEMADATAWLEAVTGAG